MVENLIALPFLAEYTRARAVAESHHRRHHQTAPLIDRVQFIKYERIQMKIYKSARHCLTCVMLSSRRPDRNVHVTRNTVPGPHFAIATGMCSTNGTIVRDIVCGFLASNY